MSKAFRSLLVAAMMLVGAQAYGQESLRQVDRAHDVVVKNAPGIMSWVYPSTTFEALAGCEWSRPGAGFALACRFNYVDDGDHDSRVLRFRLNQQGLIVGIDDRGGDSVFPAFFTLRVTKNLAASMAQEELAKNSTTLDADQRALLQFLSKSREPEEILAFLLNVQIVAGF